MPFYPWVFCGVDAPEPRVVGILWGRGRRKPWPWEGIGQAPMTG